jgi:two-component system response regulator (stage 0 sporulation protein A)
MNILEIEDELKGLKARVNELETALKATPSEFNQNADIFIQVTRLIQEMQVPPSLSGYYYIRTAIIMIYEDETLLQRITKELYPSIAKARQKTPQRVERSIRHAIETSWDKKAIKGMGHIFGAMFDEHKPTNSDFLAAVVDYLRLQNMGR